MCAWRGAVLGVALAACGPGPTSDAGHDVPILDAPDAPDAATSDTPTDAPVPLTLGMPLSGRLGAGELARHPLALTEGDWLYLAAGGAAIPDPTLALTTVAGDRVAYSEDFVQADAGAIILTRIPATATYFVEVALEPGREGDGRFTLESALLMTNGSITFEVERGDDLASATAFESMFGWVAGRYEHANDVDVFDLPDVYFSEPGTPTVVFDLMPIGPDGNGATGTPSVVRLVDASGATLGEWVPTGEEEHYELVASELAGGFLEVHGGSEPGENGFYVIRIFVGLSAP